MAISKCRHMSSLNSCLHFYFCITEFTSVFAFIGVGQVIGNRLVRLNLRNTAWVVAFQDAADLFGKGKLDLLGNLLVFDNGDGHMRIDQADDVHVDIGNVVDFDQILLAQLVAADILDQRCCVVDGLKVQCVEYLPASACCDMVDDNTSDN